MTKISGHTYVHTREGESAITAGYFPARTLADDGDLVRVQLAGVGATTIVTNGQGCELSRSESSHASVFLTVDHALDLIHELGRALEQAHLIHELGRVLDKADNLLTASRAAQPEVAA